MLLDFLDAPTRFVGPHAEGAFDDTPARTIPVGTREIRMLLTLDNADYLDPATDVTFWCMQIVGLVPTVKGMDRFRGGALPLDDNDQPTGTLRWIVFLDGSAGRDCFVRIHSATRIRLGARIEFHDGAP